MINCDNKLNQSQSISLSILNRIELFVVFRVLCRQALMNEAHQLGVHHSVENGVFYCAIANIIQLRYLYISCILFILYTNPSVAIVKSSVYASRIFIQHMYTINIDCFQPPP